MTLDTSHDPLGSLESRLEAMTVASPSNELWRAALQSARGGGGASHVGERPKSRVVTRIINGVAIVLVLALCVGVFSPAFGNARSSSRRVAVVTAPASSLMERYDVAGAVESATRLSPEVEGLSTHVAGMIGDQAHSDSIANTVSSSPEQQALIARVTATRRVGSGQNTDQGTRHVVRKATIDLSSPDVRVAASKAAFLVNEAAGEYVEASNIYGQDKQSTAQLTIRVVASRLSEVMTQLRELGVVVSETADGKDVSEQVVDIEARLRNETRIEEELLKLLASRESAPLAEILDLRKEVNASRERIERLTAQRDGLYRLTSLATILVTIRYDWKEPEVAATGWWTSFRASIADAGADGLRTLSDAVAFIVWVLIAGLMWWILLFAVAVVIWRWRRSNLKAQAAEAPPRL
jgi:hypothetical protein